MERQRIHENYIQESKRVLNYVEESEGLFSPNGRYLELGDASYFTQRMKDKISSWRLVNGNKQPESEIVTRYLDDMSGVLREQGVLGTARAHAAYSAFDSVSRTVGLDGAIDFLLSPTSKKNRTFIEYMLTSSSALVMNDGEERQLHIKEFKGEVEQYLLAIVDSSIGTFHNS